MKTWTAVGRAVAMCAIILCGAGARAQTTDPCAVPNYLLFGEFLLQRVTAAVNKDKAVKILVFGGTSSTLPGPQGATYAYPARLEAALKRRLPSVTVTILTVTKPRQSASQVAESIKKFVLDEKPNLVVWQTGTFDAVRGTDLEEFRATVDGGVATIQAGGGRRSGEHAVQPAY